MLEHYSILLSSFLITQTRYYYIILRDNIIAGKRKEKGRDERKEKSFEGLSFVFHTIMTNSRSIGRGDRQDSQCRGELCVEVSKQVTDEKRNLENEPEVR